MMDDDVQSIVISGRHVMRCGSSTYIVRAAFVAIVATTAAHPAFTNQQVSAVEQTAVSGWLARHPNMRRATIADCKCADDVALVRHGSGAWPPITDYDPYAATGDFNGDGADDLAIVVIAKDQVAKPFALVVFNGPFGGGDIASFRGVGLGPYISRHVFRLSETQTVSAAHRAL
jgi:hypothetical protein